MTSFSPMNLDVFFFLGLLIGPGAVPVLLPPPPLPRGHDRLHDSYGPLHGRRRRRRGSGRGGGNRCGTPHTCFPPPPRHNQPRSASTIPGLLLLLLPHDVVLTHHAISGGFSSEEGRWERDLWWRGEESSPITITTAGIMRQWLACHDHRRGGWYHHGWQRRGVMRVSTAAAAIRHG